MRRKIQRLIEALLNSAKKRGTEQGVNVYEMFIVKLKSASSEAKTEDLLREINKNLAGIETWGYYSDEEFGYVKRLREMDE